MSKPHSIRREGIDPRCLERGPPVAANRLVANIVSEHEDDVRFVHT